VFLLLGNKPSLSLGSCQKLKVGFIRQLRETCQKSRCRNEKQGGTLDLSARAHGLGRREVRGEAGAARVCPPTESEHFSPER